MVEFADIFIAKNLSEALQYKILEPNLPRVHLNNLTDYEISALWATLEHSSIKPRHELNYIDTDSDEVLYQLPNDFIIALANLADDDINSVAIVWAEYEEIQWQRLEAIEKIKAICELAKKTKNSQQSLYFILI